MGFAFGMKHSLVHRLALNYADLEFIEMLGWMTSVSQLVQCRRMPAWWPVAQVVRAHA